MVRNFNDIDYSNLNANLQPKRGISGITTKVAEAIGKVFLEKNTRSPKEDVLNKRINEFASNIENLSESTKVRFSLMVHHLSEKNLLNPESIKSLKIRGKDAEERIQNIMNDLENERKNPLTNQQKADLDKAISDGVEKHYTDLANKEEHEEALNKEIGELKQEKKDLENELDASEAANEVVEQAILKRRSRSNIIRVGNALNRINKNEKMDAVTKARKVLRQANSFALLGYGKRFDWINKLPKKIDVNKEYTSATEKLIKKMNETDKPKEKVAIRYIMKQVNVAYENYIKLTTITEDDRKNNMRKINDGMKMAA